MSYCRFENTLNCMGECIDALESGNVDIENMSRYEMLSYHTIINTCEELSELIAENNIK